MLNLVGRALDTAGMPYVRLDGSTPAKTRADIVREFARREVGSPVVFLVSDCTPGWEAGKHACAQV
jgi:SWI/SNF-related matrix-associated actin-dependent regulator of chromatin subfamily A3